MPTRILREGINSSPRVNQLSQGAEILYRRLMSVVDDYGRYYATPAAIRGACWPTHPTPPSEGEVSGWLAECQQLSADCPQLSADCPQSLVVVYEARGCQYLELVDFNQKIRSKSKFPAPVRKLLAIASKMPALDVVVVEDGVVVVVGENTSPAFNSVSDWFDARMSAHPNKRDAMLAQSTLSGIRDANDPAWRAEVARVHSLWCATEAWTWKQGARCPTFAQWLVDQGWRWEPPADEKTATQRAMEAL